jgi:hypothetical protein
MALPANAFKGTRVHVTNAWGFGYAVPTGKKSMILEIDVCNTTTPDAPIQIYVGICESNVSLTPAYLLINGAVVPAGTTVSVVLGQKIVLEEAGIFTKLVFKTASVSQIADAIISVMEDVQ